MGAKSTAHHWPRVNTTAKEAAERALTQARIDAGLRHLPCAADPELWYSTVASDRLTAQAICLGHCPDAVRRACRDYAHSPPVERHGVWGGRDLTPGSERITNPETPADVWPLCNGGCGRHVRPEGVTAAEAPDTLATEGGGMCKTCRSRWRKAKARREAA